MTSFDTNQRSYLAIGEGLGDIYVEYILSRMRSRSRSSWSGMTHHHSYHSLSRQSESYRDSAP